MLNNLYQSLDPVAFTIGPFSARWYGLAYVAGFICVIAIMYVVGKRWKMRFDFDSLCIIMLCAMVGVIVGGRLGYVLFYNWDMYAANPLAILEFSRGGMSFHGGFIGALVAGIVAARMVHMPIFPLLTWQLSVFPLAFSSAVAQILLTANCGVRQPTFPGALCLAVLPARTTSSQPAVRGFAGRCVAVCDPLRDVAQAPAVCTRHVFWCVYGGVWHLPLPY